MEDDNPSDEKYDVYLQEGAETMNRIVIYERKDEDRRS